MIIDFKIFEQSQFKFKKGDYVVGINININDKFLKNFLENSVGQIVSIEKRVGQNIKNYKFVEDFWYEVYYEKVPEKAKTTFWMDDIYNYEEDELRLATPEEIEIQQQINKYNI